MKLEDLFEPVSNSILAEAALQLPASLGRLILPIIPEVTTPKEADILLVGLYDNSNESFGSPDDIRRELYTLYAPAGMSRIADLGNIPKEMNADQVENCLSRLSKYCLKEKKNLVVFSPDRNHALPLFNSLQKERKNIGVTIVDSTIPLSDTASQNAQNGIFSHFIQNPSKEIEYLNIIGIQNYLTNPVDVDLSNKLFVEILRLGQLRGDIKSCEPLLRDSSLVNFNMRSIRHSDNPACNSSGPNGLYAEEACAIARYAGYADKVDFFCVFGDFKNFGYSISVSTVAQLIWHYFDGFAKRKGEYPVLKNANLQKFIVKIEDNEEDLVFYKSKHTDRWWMEIPSTKKNIPNKLIACSYDEYLDATKHDIPFRWLFHLKKNN